MAERLSHLERLVSPSATEEERELSRHVALWIGTFFEESHGIRGELMAEREKIESDKQLEAAIKSGSVLPGGSEYMEPDTDSTEGEVLDA